MTWVIDASNVIGSRPDGWWRDRAGATRRLVARLDRFAAETDEPVVVVLDAGPAPPAERAEIVVATRRGRVLVRGRRARRRRPRAARGRV